MSKEGCIKDWELQDGDLHVVASGVFGRLGEQLSYNCK